MFRWRNPLPCRARCRWRPGRPRSWRAAPPGPPSQAVARASSPAAEQGEGGPDPGMLQAAAFGDHLELRLPERRRLAEAGVIAGIEALHQLEGADVVDLPERGQRALGARLHGGA